MSALPESSGDAVEGTHVDPSSDTFATSDGPPPSTLRDPDETAAGFDAHSIEKTDPPPQGGHAAHQFQSAFERLEGHARAHPEDDRDQANVGVALARPGDTAQQLNSDAVAARRFFTRAWDLQQSVLLHPRNHFYSALDRTRLLSHYALKRGVACFHLGDPGAALRWVGESINRRRAWVAAEPKSVPAVSYLAEALTWGGTSACHAGDRPSAQPQFTAALAIYAKLRQQFPRSGEFLGDQATIAAAQADCLLRWGALDEARGAYELSLKNVEAVLAHDADDAEKRALRASVLKGLAALGLRQGKPADAEARYRDALKVRADLAGLEPQNRTAAAQLAVALAHCGRSDEASSRADSLRRAKTESAEFLVFAARVYAACAHKAQGEDHRRNADAALDMLKAAIEKGYRDVVAFQSDPDPSQLKEDDRSQTMFSELGPR